MSKCPYCGNNPVPHWLYWYNESLNILLTPLRQQILYNPLTAWLKRRNLGNALSLAAARLLQDVGMVRLESDRTQCKIDRAAVLWEEAERRGIAMRQLVLWGKPLDVYWAAKSGRQLVFSGLPRPAGSHNRWLDLMDDKWLLKQRLAACGLPVPPGRAATSLAQARRIFTGLQKPCIVKPRAGSRGRHSTTYVFTEEELAKAYRVAKQLCHWVMVEEHLPGPVYRATVINFALAGVLRGDPPKVIGDGERTIAELARRQNREPHAGVKDIILDSRTERFLSRRKLSLSSVPAAGQEVELTEKIGVSYGGSSSEDYEICHPDNRDLFIRAARALDDPIVGFDFIIPDISQSWRTQRCGFIEANSLPFINLHHNPLHGKPRNAAALIWQMMGM
ncbi:MAG TPA: hypothetical protein VHA30_03765 [Patescibacteria group bacterium]|nr:hypothetical protein [Patescibacteria group bacterium]